MGNIIFKGEYDKYSCSKCEYYPTKQLRNRCEDCQYKFESEIMFNCTSCFEKYEKIDKYGNVYFECKNCRKRHRKYRIERFFEKDTVEH